jgi:hypothetical protein
MGHSYSTEKVKDINRHILINGSAAAPATLAAAPATLAAAAAPATLAAAPAPAPAPAPAAAPATLAAAAAPAPAPADPTTLTAPAAAPAPADPTTLTAPAAAPAPADPTTLTAPAAAAPATLAAPAAAPAAAAAPADATTLAATNPAAGTASPAGAGTTTGKIGHTSDEYKQIMNTTYNEATQTFSQNGKDLDTKAVIDFINLMKKWKDIINYKSTITLLNEIKIKEPTKKYSYIKSKYIWEDPKISYEKYVYDIKATPKESWASKKPLENSAKTVLFNLFGKLLEKYKEKNKAFSGGARTKQTKKFRKSIKNQSYKQKSKRLMIQTKKNRSNSKLSFNKTKRRSALGG